MLAHTLLAEAEPGGWDAGWHAVEERLDDIVTEVIEANDPLTARRNAKEARLAAIADFGGQVIGGG